MAPKIMIPGDKLSEFFAFLAEVEKKKEPMRNQLTDYNKEFHDYLVCNYSERTARKHSMIIDMLIEFLCGDTDVVQISEITKGLVNTNFQRWYKRKVCSSNTATDVKVAVSKFFNFLSSEKQVHLPLVMGKKPAE